MKFSPDGMLLKQWGEPSLHSGWSTQQNIQLFQKFKDVQYDLFVGFKKVQSFKQ